MSKLNDDRTNIAKAETLVTNEGFRKGDKRITLEETCMPV